MARARIFQRIKSTMQSGRARTTAWVLEHEPAEPKRADPLTGWAGSGDTAQQVRLTFPTLDAARAYAEANGLDYAVVSENARSLKLQSYADNFR